MLDPVHHLELWASHVAGCAGFEIVANRRLVEPYPKPTIDGSLDAGPELHVEPELDHVS